MASVASINQRDYLDWLASQGISEVEHARRVVERVHRHPGSQCCQTLKPRPIEMHL